MIKGINGVVYYDMEDIVDYDSFKKLEVDILAGIAEAREYACEGLWIETKQHKNTSFPNALKSLSEALVEFEALPLDHPMREPVEEWYQKRNDVHYRNLMTRYLKSCFGAYDPYYVFFIKDGTPDYEYGVCPRKNLPNISEYFKSLIEWVDNLENTVFSKIEYIYLAVVEHDGIPTEHRDLVLCNGENEDYSTNRKEFVHLRPDTARPLYVWDPETKNKTFINSRASYFNDEDWHGTIRNNSTGWFLRLDGEFTEAVRRKLGLENA